MLASVLVSAAASNDGGFHCLNHVLYIVDINYFRPSDTIIYFVWVREKERKTDFLSLVRAS